MSETVNLRQTGMFAPRPVHPPLTDSNLGPPHATNSRRSRRHCRRRSYLVTLLQDDEPTDWLGWPRPLPHSIQDQRQARQECEAIRHEFHRASVKRDRPSSCHSNQFAVSVTRITCAATSG